MSVNKEEKCDHLDTENICVNKTTQGSSNPELKSPRAKENSYLSLSKALFRNEPYVFCFEFVSPCHHIGMDSSPTKRRLFFMCACGRCSWKVDQSDFAAIALTPACVGAGHTKNASALNTNLRGDASAARLDGGFISL
jgi:hypothetical protein